MSVPLGKSWKIKRAFVIPDDLTCKSREAENDIFAQEVKNWLKRKKILIAPSTYAGYQYAVNDIVEYFGPREYLRTTGLTSSDVEAYLNWERERRKVDGEGAKRIKTKDGSGVEATLMRRLAVIRMVLQEAKRDGRITHNPAAKSDSWITLPRPQVSSYTVLTVDEAKCLCGRLRNEESWFEVAVLLALLYGLRRSEVIGLRITDIDFEQQRIMCRNTVTQQTIGGRNIITDKAGTKTRDIKIFTLSPKMYRMVMKLAEKNKNHMNMFAGQYDTAWQGYLFTYPDGRLISLNHLSQKFSAFLTKNGMKKMRFHDLRHNCASILYSQGVSPKTIQQILGHTQLATTTEIYTHLFGMEKDIATDNLSAELLGTDDDDEDVD